MSDPSNFLAAEPNFSLVQGGPLFQLLLRAGLTELRLS